MASMQEESERQSLVPGACNSCHWLGHDLSGVLKTACTFGHLGCIRASLAAGADVNRCFRGSHLYRDILYDKCVAFLIKSGARILDEVVSRAGEKGSERCVNLILEAGGDPEVMMYYAAEAGRCHVVELLIKAGVDVNTCGALICAAASGSVECVNLLLQAGADVNITAKGCRSSCSLSINISANNCFTPLIAGVRSVQCIDTLLKAGADVNIHDYYGRTALFEAVSRGSVESVALLIKTGADVNIRDKDGKTPLLYAGQCGRLDKIKIDLLVKAGADVNVTDGDGNTALFQNTDYGLSPSYIRAVIHERIKVNVTNNHGCNALTTFLSSCHLDDLHVKNNKEFAMLLFAAGETIDERKLQTVQDYLTQSKDVDLMNICRGSIRNHLLQLSDVNLFVRVQDHPLPRPVARYITVR